MQDQAHSKLVPVRIEKDKEDPTGKRWIVPKIPLRARGGDQIEFLYPGKKATLFFPVEGVFEEQIVHFEPGSPSRAVVNVLREGVFPKEFAYAIYLRDEDTFVEAASPPRMIIDPPGD